MHRWPLPVVIPFVSWESLNLYLERQMIEMKCHVLLVPHINTLKGEVQWEAVNLKYHIFMGGGIYAADTSPASLIGHLWIYTAHGNCLRNTMDSQPHALISIVQLPA
jgi:hypothetical protein